MWVQLEGGKGKMDGIEILHQQSKLTVFETLAIS